MNKLSQKGAITIILSVLLLSIVLVISASVYNLMIQQIRASNEIGRSIVAIYAAESGLERCYFDYLKNGVTECSYSPPNNSLDTITDATYTIIEFNGSSPIISVGNYLRINRRIELTWE